jgi:hypothetical protein
MAQEVSDLGTGLGYIYVTQPDGTSIVSALLNTPENARNIKLDGLKATSVGLNRSASATITIDTITGSGSITSIATAAGVEQFDTGTPIVYTGGVTTTAALASLINDAMNAYDEASGEDCTTVLDGSTVNAYLEASAGSGLNGSSLIVTSTGNMTNTVTAFTGGSDASELYDEGIGYRFFLNADYSAGGCAGEGVATADSLTNSFEITDYIIPRSMNMSIPNESLSIVDGVLTVDRSSVETLVYLDTQSAAASDNLDSILATGFVAGDKITIRGANSGRITTVRDGVGNIELEGGNNFLTADTETAITLQLKDSTWYELNRTSQSVGATSDYRTAGFGFFGIDTYNTAAVATTGTVTFNGGTDSKLQKLTGTDTLTGNTTYALGTGVNGDKFVLEYDAAVTEGAFALSIFGITLTTEQALNGGLIFEAEYKSGAWYPRVYPNLNDGSTYTWQADTPDIKNDAVTPAKVSENLEKDWKHVDVSFETSEVGDMKFVMPACTVTNFNAAVSKAIAATDNATIVPKDHSAAVMTSGTLTLTAGTAIGTSFTSTPSGNNTFAEGEIMTLTTAKTTPGGRAKVSFRITRL